MGIFRAVGLGIGIIVLKLLVPEIFSSLQKTLITFFDVLQNILANVPTSKADFGAPNIAGVGFVPDIQTSHYTNVQGYTN